MKAPLYYLDVAALITHELDAVRHAEWGLLYLLRDLPQTEAYTTFVGLHVPIVFAILWFSSHSNPRIQSGCRIAV